MRHLHDSCLLTAAECRKIRVKTQKTGAFSQHCSYQYWLKASVFVCFMIFLQSAPVYRHESWRCCTLLPFFILFCDFYLNKKKVLMYGDNKNRNRKG